MNYREQTETGTSWRRCHEVHIYNPLEGATKLVRMDEQDVVSFNGKSVSMNAGYISKVFDPAGEIVLLDPQTGQPTGGVMTQAALYQALYSLYMQCATERDEAQP